MTDALLGIDVGTTSTKAVLFDLDGRELACASSPPYRMFTPSPGWIEQDPEEVWSALLACMRSALTQAGEVRVKAVCMAVQSGSLIPADGAGKPVYPLVTWMDGRAEEIVQEWKAERHQAWVKPLSGWSLYSSLCLPTIAWFKKNDMRTFASAKIFFSLNDFLVFRLTRKMVTNPSNASGMQLVNIKNGQWSNELCRLAGIDKEQLAQIQPAGTVIGEVLPEVCRQTGLASGTPLVNGAHDQVCTALGLGMTAPGKVLLACGTAWVFTSVLTSPGMAHLPPTLDVNFHAAPERWTLSQSLGGLGASFEWWMNKAFACETRALMFSTLNAEISQTRLDGGLFFLPLTGGHDDPATTRRGGFLGLQLGHSRADMARAIMESAAYELRWALEPVLSTNIPIDQLCMVGGAAQNPLWPIILANVTGIPISLPDYDTWPALGAAILAGYGVSIFPSLEVGCRKFEKPHKTVTPQASVARDYQSSFQEYQRLCSLFHTSARVS